MSVTDNIKSYSYLTEKINQDYANLHNYDFEIFNEVMTNRAPQWCKIKVINKLLALDKYDYLFWIDADAFFNKKDIKLETFINEDPSKDVIICDDIMNSGREFTLNSGTFFVKCSEWSKEFFQKVWDYDGDYLYNHFHEQTIIENYIKDNIMDASKHIVIKPCRAFNTEITVQLNDGTIYDNFIIHLMAHPSEFRVKFITELNNKNDNLIETFVVDEKVSQQTNWWLWSYIICIACIVFGLSLFLVKPRPS